MNREHVTYAVRYYKSRAPSFLTGFGRHKCAWAHFEPRSCISPYCRLWTESAWAICTHICTYIVICGEESEGRYGGRRRGRAKGKRGSCPTPGVLLTRCAALPRGIRADTCMHARMHARTHDIHTRTHAHTHAHTHAYEARPDASHCVACEILTRRDNTYTCTCIRTSNP